MRWSVWRVATHPRINDSLTEIRTRWSLADVWEANVVLDEIDRFEAESSRERPR